MKVTEYVTKFENHSGYTKFLASYDYEIPNVSYCEEENHVHYSKNYKSQYLTFVPLEDMRIAFWDAYNSAYLNWVSISGDTYYSLDGGYSWTLLPRKTYIDVPYGTKCMFKGNLKPHSTWGCGIFRTEGDCNAEGNFCSMTKMDNFMVTSDSSNYRDLFSGTSIISAAGLETAIKSGGNFQMMFYDCHKLSIPPKLTNLTKQFGSRTFWYTFAHCHSLTEVPEFNFPDMMLRYGCFDSMFYDCIGLKKIPSFTFTANPSYNQDNEACEHMFDRCSGVTEAGDITIEDVGYATFRCMYAGCKSLKVAPKLNILTGKVDHYGMAAMFEDCTSLEVAPELSGITELGMNACVVMFGNCTSLKTPPTLPRDPMGNMETYWGMFRDCTALETAPDMSHIERVSTRTMTYMYAGCTSLKNAPELPAESGGQACYYGMFSGCTALETAPSVLPIKKLIGSNGSAANYIYQNMFTFCKNLTKAPDIEAESLYNKYNTAGVEACFKEMFYGCDRLSEIKVYFMTDTDPEKDQLTNWVYSVAPTGTFYMPENTNWEHPTGYNGVPSGWEIKTFEYEPEPSPTPEPGPDPGPEPEPEPTPDPEPAWDVVPDGDDGHEDDPE